MPEVDAWMGVGPPHGIIAACQRALCGQGGSYWGQAEDPPDGWEEDPLRLLSTPSHYAYLKIAEGCRNGCSYCVIPSLRGDLRSRPLPSLLEEAEELVGQGARELILVAQDLGNYGKDLIPPTSLVPLLERMDGIKGLEWIRLLYVHPAHVTEELIQAMASLPKVCPYLDLPIQHIEDGILSAMNRRVSSAQIWGLIEKLRSALPDLRLRTTVMVGFPGEDEARFSALLDFIRQAQFDHLGAFAYSREEGTVAARMKGQVPQRVKERRLREIMEAQAEISGKRNRALVGTIQRVLIDEIIPCEGPVGKGRTSWQAPEIDGVVYVKKGAGKPGEFMEVRITEADTYDLVGERLV